MKKKFVNNLFIYAFLFLYALVAFISFCHAIEFFNIGNVEWMSIMLAFAFELGLAVCLASILIGTNKRNNIAWILLILLVIVQVVGNTYSVFKFISESELDYYNYLAKPLLFWIQEVSEETVQIIVSWIMGAILPVVALLMTEMVANGIKEQQATDVDIEQVNNVTENVTDVTENVTNTSEEPIEYIVPQIVNHMNNDSSSIDDHVDLIPEESEIETIDDFVENHQDESILQKAFDLETGSIIDDVQQNHVQHKKAHVDVMDRLERDAEKLNPNIK